MSLKYEPASEPLHISESETPTAGAERGAAGQGLQEPADGLGQAQVLLLLLDDSRA